MELITILSICAVFFSLFIIAVHLSYIGFKYFTAKSKKQKENDKEKMRALLEEIRKEEHSKTLDALNTLDKH